MTWDYKFLCIYGKRGFDILYSFEVEQLISEFYKIFPINNFKTYIVNYEKEFSCYSQIEAQLKVAVYLAGVYSSFGKEEAEKTFILGSFI